MKNTIQVTNRGVESAGLPSDYQHVISEYIWNGFDAGASEILIQFDSNEIDSINNIHIIDNGSGIDLSTLDLTFGNFLDSTKKESLQRSSYVHGHKGKGRFSFALFAENALWQTIYHDRKSKKNLEYEIKISAGSKQDYSYDKKKISHKEAGTKLTLSGLTNVTAYNFYNDDFKDFLAKEFGWFLFLNRDSGYCIKINGEPIVYNYIIADNEIIDLTIEDHNNISHQFKITFVRWNEKIREKFYFYYLNSTLKEVAKELTTFNNNPTDFNHSVYIESTFFDNYNPNDGGKSLNLYENNSQSPVTKKLKKSLLDILSYRYKQYINNFAADKLIKEYKQNGVFPNFRQNKYEQEREKDLIRIVREIYCIEPKLFKNLNKEQQKTSVGLINLLLDTDERDNLLKLISEIVKMTAEERAILSNTLKKTTLSKITRTINLIENRFKIINLLKNLIYDNKKFTQELPHIQKSIEENIWLFGEQYHIVSANESFNTLLNKYIDFLSGNKSTTKKTKDDGTKRPDIFICQKHAIPDVNDGDSLMEENLMIELKKPSVIIGKKQLRQIEDYMHTIINDAQFNSQKRFWKFFVVSNTIDEYILSCYDEFRNKGKRFLVKSLKNYEIYAMTWDDIFKTFELRHMYLIEKLEFDKSAILDELDKKGISFSKDGSTSITKKILKLSEHS